MQCDGSALGLTMDAPREQRAGRTHGSVEGEALDRSPLVILDQLVGCHDVTLGARHGVGLQVNRKVGFGHLDIVRDGQRRDQVNLLRLATGAALLLLAFTRDFSGFYLVLAGLGGVVMFSAVHDRCPVWQAIKGFLSDKTKRLS